MVEMTPVNAQKPVSKRLSMSMAMVLNAAPTPQTGAGRRQSKKFCIRVKRCVDG